MTGSGLNWATTARLITGSALIAAILAALTDSAEARPGGGQSYSGGGGFGGGGSGGGGSGDGGAIFELIYLLVRLAIYYPKIGLPLLIIVVIGVIYFARQKRQMADWDSGPPVHFSQTRELDDIRTLDPEFSTVLFQDFAFRLYAQAQIARGQRSLDALAPYLSNRARAQLASRTGAGQVINYVVIGAMRIVRVQLPSAQHGADGDRQIELTLDFESNLTITSDTQRRTHYLVERWFMFRSADVRSRPPEATANFPCPNCGAPFESTESQRCAYCGEVVDNGRFDWVVRNTTILYERDSAPTLTGTVPERGTDLPTQVHSALHVRWNQLTTEDPALTRDSIGARLALIYHELNQAWSARQLEPIRPFVSDGMFDYLQYWITAYREQGLRNLLEDMRITNWTQAKLTRDRHFDALTVRLWATGVDYTVDQAGKVVGGSRRKNRDY
ncbi:MAG: TIM44-like domain-containing protein, partial [Myxococcota bacterium]